VPVRYQHRWRRSIADRPELSCTSVLIDDESSVPRLAELTNCTDRCPRTSVLNLLPLVHVS
jgi:hypothetical protein